MPSRETLVSIRSRDALVCTAELERGAGELEGAGMLLWTLVTRAELEEGMLLGSSFLTAVGEGPIVRRAALAGEGVLVAVGEGPILRRAALAAEGVLVAVGEGPTVRRGALAGEGVVVVESSRLITCFFGSVSEEEGASWWVNESCLMGLPTR
jgi:hypothetical protein